MSPAPSTRSRTGVALAPRPRDTEMKAFLEVGLIARSLILDLAGVRAEQRGNLLIDVRYVLGAGRAARHQVTKLERDDLRAGVVCDEQDVVGAEGQWGRRTSAWGPRPPTPPAAASGRMRTGPRARTAKTVFEATWSTPSSGRTTLQNRTRSKTSCYHAAAGPVAVYTTSSTATFSGFGIRISGSAPASCRSRHPARPTPGSSRGQPGCPTCRRWKRVARRGLRDPPDGARVHRQRHDVRRPVPPARPPRSPPAHTSSGPQPRFNTYRSSLFLAPSPGPHFPTGRCRRTSLRSTLRT